MKTISSLSELLFPNLYRRRVLGLLFMKQGEWIHLREIARITGAVPGTLKKELDALTHIGLLNSKRVGNQVQFTVNTLHPVFPELRALIVKTVGAAEIVQQHLRVLEDKINFAFIYGSVASGTEKATSDLDLMLIGDISFQEAISAVQPAESALAREINPNILTLSEWKKKKASDSSFIRDILLRPKIMLIGMENEL